jgi:hypothetical protein
MAIIPSNEKVFMVSNSTNTVYGGSAAMQAMTKWYTMEDVTNTVRPYQVFTALLTQSGGDDPSNLSGNPLVIGTTYTIDGYADGDDFTNVGAPYNANGVSFIATGTIANSFEYGAALLYNTGAPVATVLENTIGNIWFSYYGVGSYYIYNENQFDTAKTTYTFTYANYYSYLTAQFDDGGVMPAINITARDVDGANVDSYLYHQPIEIRVYN